MKIIKNVYTKVPGVGVEPTTTRLKVWRSTTELAGQNATCRI